MNRHFIAGMAPIALLSLATSIALAEPQGEALSKSVPLDETAMDNVTAGSGISIYSSSSGGGSTSINVTNNGTGNITSNVSGDGVKVISKTTPDGKNTAVTLTYTIKDKSGKPQTVTEHKIIPGTNSNISITQVPGQKPLIKIGTGPAGVYINHKPPHPVRHPVVIHKPIFPKLPHVAWTPPAAHMPK